MVKFPEAAARIQRNIFVCRNCKAKRRSSMRKILAGKIACRNCGSTALRPVRKK